MRGEATMQDCVVCRAPGPKFYPHDGCTAARCDRCDDQDLAPMSVLAMMASCRGEEGRTWRDTTFAGWFRASLSAMGRTEEALDREAEDFPPLEPGIYRLDGTVGWPDRLEPDR